MEFVFWALIGKSSFANTSILLTKDKNKDLVIKRTNLESCDSVTLASFVNEIIICRNLNHSNILSLYSAFVRSGCLFTVHPLMSLGSCVDLINASYQFGLPEKCILLIVYDVMKALEYLHGMSYIHRGVKGSHILLSSDGNVKLSGHKSIISLIKNGVKKSVVHDYPKQHASLLPWLSPEILQQNKQGYGPKSDIYSLGITACELANGHAPFIDMPTTQMLLEKLNGTMPYLLDKTTIPENLVTETSKNENPGNNEQIDIKKVASERLFSPSFHMFSQACLQKDVETRPDLYLLWKHDFLEYANIPQIRNEIFENLLSALTPISTKSISKDNTYEDIISNNFEKLQVQDCWNF